MKNTHHILLILLILLALPATAKAQLPGIGGPIPVIDYAHIALNTSHHTIDYVEQVAQVLKLIQQIQQMYDYLERFGDPKFIQDLSGVEALLADLSDSGLIEPTAAIVAEAIGSDVFDYDGLGVFESIGERIIIDGRVGYERDPIRYRPEDAAHKTLENYRDVQASVLARREEMKGAVAATIASIQAATTASEVQKLQGVLTGLQTQLSAVDQELEFAGMENLARMLENENQQRVKAKAEAERGSRSLKTGISRDQEFYPLFAEPVYFTEKN